MSKNVFTSGCCMGGESSGGPRTEAGAGRGGAGSLVEGAAGTRQASSRAGTRQAAAEAGHLSSLKRAPDPQRGRSGFKDAVTWQPQTQDSRFPGYIQ